MNRYDPEHAPNPQQWLALDEQIRIDLVEKHHRQARIKLPSLKAHAVMHVIVENQCAEKLESVVRAMARLRAEGLSRHDAMHAVASVLTQHMHDIFNAKVDTNNAQAVYDAAVERLTAESWHDG